jgi:hypothetical protein
MKEWSLNSLTPSTAPSSVSGGFTTLSLIFMMIMSSEIKRSSEERHPHAFFQKKHIKKCELYSIEMSRNGVDARDSVDKLGMITTRKEEEEHEGMNL